MQNEASSNFWCWEPVLQPSSSSRGKNIAVQQLIYSTGPLELCTLLLTYKPRCMNYYNSASLNFPLYKGRKWYIFFTKLSGRCLLCSIRTSLLIITQTARKIQRSKSFLECAINIFLACFAFGSVTNWKKHSSLWTSLSSCTQSFSISQCTTDSGGGAEGRRKVMILAATPLWFAKIAAWQIWFLKYLMFC